MRKVGVFVLFLGLISQINAGDKAHIDISISLSEKPGFLTYKIKNISKKEIKVGLMSCGRSSNWEIESESITLNFSPALCSKTYCGGPILKPNQVETGEVPIIRNSSQPEEIKMRLGYKPCKTFWRPEISEAANEVIWSNEIDVNSKLIPTYSEKGDFNNSTRDFKFDLQKGKK